MVKTTDAAVRVAARLAAEIIRRADTLTAEQVGTIAHTLGIEQGASDLHPCGVSWRERGMTGSPRTCTLPAGHDGPHGSIR